MVLGRFKQNSAVLHPSLEYIYLGEICGEGEEKGEKGKEEITYLSSLDVQVQPECVHRGALSFSLCRHP